MRNWRLPERLYHAITAAIDSHAEFHRRSRADFRPLRGAVRPLRGSFLQDPQNRQFAETALRAERSLGLDKMAFGQVLGTIGSMIPETEAIFEADIALSNSTRTDPRTGARSADAAQPVRAARDQHVAGGRRSAASRPLELEEETRRDALTGVYNRAYLDQFLGRASSSTRRATNGR